jgi:anionic cell wall polymer biosynthesis LytR-Cps2A-Psr (LCP) family protein
LAEQKETKKTESSPDSHGSHGSHSHHSSHHSHHSSRHSRSRLRRIRTALFSHGRKGLLLRILLAAGAVALLALLYLGLTRLEKSLDKPPEGAGLALSRAEEPEEQSLLYYNGKKYLRRERQTTLLILGIDDAEVTESQASRNGGQADFIALAVFDPVEERCTLLQLNRDTMTDVPVPDGRGGVARYAWEQLALAHTYGNGLEKSCEYTADAVSRLLYNVEIDDYFALTMDAIPVLNDLVGGVTVTVEDDFSGVDETLIKGKTVRLTAENVENFVRARSNMPDDKTNLNRMERQKVYLAGLFEALRTALEEDGEFVPRAYTALSGSLVSDCTVTELSLYAERFSVYELGEIVSPEGEAVKGEKYMEFYTDEEALQELVLRVFYRPVA